MNPENQRNYADIILPLALERTYSYEIPNELLQQTQVGKRVQVQFGSKRMYAGIVHRIYQQEPPKDFRIKSILSVLDEQAILHPAHLELWEWMSEWRYRFRLSSRGL